MQLVMFYSSWNLLFFGIFPLDTGRLNPDDGRSRLISGFDGLKLHVRAARHPSYFSNTETPRIDLGQLGNRFHCLLCRFGNLPVFQFCGVKFHLLSSQTITHSDIVKINSTMITTETGRRQGAVCGQNVARVLWRVLRGII